MDERVAYYLSYSEDDADPYFLIFVSHMAAAVAAVEMRSMVQSHYYSGAYLCHDLGSHSPDESFVFSSVVAAVYHNLHQVHYLPSVLQGPRHDYHSLVQKDHSHVYYSQTVDDQQEYEPSRSTVEYFRYVPLGLDSWI